MKRYQPGPYYLRYWCGLRCIGKQPFTLRRYRYSTQVVDASGKVATHLCLRGNSKQRRQQARLALRYLNQPILEEAKVDSLIIEVNSRGREYQLHNLHFSGDPRQLEPLANHINAHEINEAKLPDFDDAELRTLSLLTVLGGHITPTPPPNALTERTVIVHIGKGGTTGDYPALDGTTFKLRE